MSGSIHLIVEDKTDAEVVQAIVDAKAIPVRIRPLMPTGGSGGISRLSAQLDKLIRSALRKRRAYDCIAILHDADEHVQQSHRHDYDQIETICQSYRQDVVLVIAKDEIESWLLADEGLCKWLNTKAKNCDNENKPSDLLNSLVKQRTGKKYSGSIRTQTLKYLDGSGDKHSPSMRKAMTHLDNAPCVRDT